MKATVAGSIFVTIVQLSQGAESTATNALRRGGGTLVSPEVHSDRRVTFRLRAPEATGVKVSGEWGGRATEMTNDNGTWSATLGPLEPDVYGYSFTVGTNLTFADPANPRVKPMRAMRTSVLHVPGEPSEIWDFQTVPHGSVHIHDYYSKAVETRRRLHVYTPPGYEKGKGTLPVLYLFHGAGDNDATWSSFGHAHWIADNLIAQGKAKPMIIVMTDGHAVSGNPTRVGPDLINRNVQAFRDDLLKDVMPLIDSIYRTKPNRNDRAIIGLSMGGGQSLAIGMKERELFGWVGGMSSYIPNPEKVVADAFGEKKHELKLLWIACGKEDRLINNAKQLSDALKERGIAHQYKETEGNHTWPVWRRYLAEFMPLLFDNRQ